MTLALSDHSEKAEKCMSPFVNIGDKVKFHDLFFYLHQCFLKFACRPWSLRHSQQGDRSLNSASLPTFYQREPRACRLCQVMNPQGEFNHSGGSINQNTYNWLTYLHSKFWIATLELDWTCLDAREVGFWRLCGSLPPLWSVRYYGPWVCVARLLRLSRSLIWSTLCSSRKSCRFILIFKSQYRC